MDAASCSLSSAFSQGYADEPHLLVSAIAEGCSRRLIEDALHVEARNAASVLRGLPLRVVEVGCRQYCALQHKCEATGEPCRQRWRCGASGIFTCQLLPGISSQLTRIQQASGGKASSLGTPGTVTTASLTDRPRYASAQHTCQSALILVCMLRSLL